MFSHDASRIIKQDFGPCHDVMFEFKKVKVSNDQEIAQSE